MCGHTIRKQGPILGGHRSPFAVDEKKKPLTLKHAARDLGIDLSQLAKVWARGEDASLWHRNGGRELYLNGGVTMAMVAEANKRRQVDCTVQLSKADLLKIKGWPKERRESFEAVWEAAQEYRRSLEARKIAEARAAFDEIENIIRARYELEKNRVSKPAPAPLAPPQLILEFVQSTSADAPVQATSVERTHGENEGEKRTVPSAHIRNQRNPSENSAAATSVLWTESRALASELKIDAAAGKTLLLDCRNIEPTITATEIAGLAREKLAKNPKVGNPTGLLLKTVAQWCTTQALHDLRNARRVAGRADAAAKVLEEEVARQVLGEGSTDPMGMAWTEKDKEWARGILYSLVPEASKKAGGGA
jgi:hypothetical protein